MFFLVLSIVYGYLAYQIRLYPGDELEAMTARTLPLLLSGLGIFFSLVLLATGNRKDHGTAIAGLDWKPVILLMLLSLVYGFALDWIGFLVSTTLFLIAGFRILGEGQLSLTFQGAIGLRRITKGRCITHNVAALREKNG